MTTQPLPTPTALYPLSNINTPLIKQEANVIDMMKLMNISSNSSSIQTRGPGRPKKYHTDEERIKARQEYNRRNREKILKKDPYYYIRYAKNCPCCVCHENSSGSGGIYCEICHNEPETFITWNCNQNNDPDEPPKPNFYLKLTEKLMTLPNFNGKMINYYTSFYNKMINHELEDIDN